MRSPKRKIRKPVKVYALTLMGGLSVIRLYRRRIDAETDQQYHRERTDIMELFLYDKPMWREHYKEEMAKLEQELKNKEREIGKKLTAYRSALACGEES